MRIIRSLRSLQAWRRQQEGFPGNIGFVPTMGALHQGHLSLIQKARKQCDLVIVSVFVNPLQFGPTEDLARYPRTVNTDQRLCREEGVDVLFLPPKAELYPQGFQTTVKVNQLSQRWEGEARPTHFEGVATVVTKLLCLVSPDFSYFGQKDYQQWLVIQQMVRDLHLGGKLVCCLTIRESDGLAMSSRNQYLSTEQRQKAVLLFKALQEGIKAIKNGETSGKNIQAQMKRMLGRESGISVDYLAVCDAQTLEPMKRVKGQAVLLGAVRIGKIRLIDNVLVRGTRKS